MHIEARDATPDDLLDLERLYAAFAEEQAGLRPLWHEAEGLAPPAPESLSALVDNGVVSVGPIEGAVFGFLVHGTLNLVDERPRLARTRRSASRW